jgi:hypothetical protein
LTSAGVCLCLLAGCDGAARPSDGALVEGVKHFQIRHGLHGHDTKLDRALTRMRLFSLTGPE